MTNVLVHPVLEQGERAVQAVAAQLIGVADARPQCGIDFHDRAEVAIERRHRRARGAHDLGLERGQRRRRDLSRRQRVVAFEWSLLGRMGCQLRDGPAQFGLGDKQTTRRLVEEGPGLGIRGRMARQRQVVRAVRARTGKPEAFDCLCDTVMQQIADTDTDVAVVRRLGIACLLMRFHVPARRCCRCW